MAIITNQFTIDANQAITTLQSVQAAFQAHNAAIGTISNQYASFNRKSKDTRLSFTQIDSAGRKVTTTLKEVGGAYEAVSTKIGLATSTQRRFAAELEAQRVLADRLAKSYNPVSRGTTPTTGIPAVDPKKLGANPAIFASLTSAQVATAAAANGLNAAQTKAFQTAVTGAGRARGSIVQLTAGVERAKSAFSQLGQIAFATAIYRGLSLIQLGLTQGAKNAVEYSRQIGLIQTLARDGSDNFDTWNKSIRGVADSLGLPVADVASATYDALSNQVIRTSKDMELLSIAGELARNTNSNITESLNVLSSILNTYGTQAGSAQQISDELFKTVDLGRVRMNELNGVIGRTAGIAKTAGVSLRELEAGLIVQTQAGLDSAESATLLSNVYIQLIKPNDALAAQFRKMGYDSGQAAVATLGFAGVMRTLATAAKETDEGIATFFPEIRGLRGAATFAGEGIDKLEQSLRALELAQGANAEASKVLSQNLGQKLLDEVQRVKNFFTVDFGKTALEVIATVTQAFGGMESIVKNISKYFIIGASAATTFFAVSALIIYGKAVATIGLAFVQVSQALGYANAAGLIFGQTAQALQVKVALIFGGLGIAIAATLAVVVAAMAYADSFSREAATRIADYYKLSSDAIKVDAETTAKVRIETFVKATTEGIRQFGLYVAASKIANNALRDSAKEKAVATESVLKNNFQVLIGIAHEGLNKLQNQEKQAAENSKRVQKDRVTLTEDYEKKKLDRQLGRLDKGQDVRSTGQTFGLTENQSIRKTVTLLQQRNLLLTKREKISIDEGDLNSAKKYLDEILNNIETLDSYKGRAQAAQHGGRDPKLQFNTDKASANALKTYLTLTDSLNAKNGKKATTLAKNIEGEKQEIKILEDLLAKTSAFATKGIFDKSGDLLPKFIDNGEAANIELDRLQKEALIAADSLKGVGDPLTLIQYKAALAEIEKSFGDQRANVAKQVQQAQTDKALTKARQAQEETSKAANEAVNAVTTSLKEQNVVIDQGILKIQAFGEAIKSQSSSAVDTTNIYQHLNPFDSGFGQGFSTADAAKVQKFVNSLNATLAQPVKNIKLAKAQLAELTLLVQQIAPNLQIANPEDKAETITYLEALTRQKAALEEVEKSSAQKGNTEEQLAKQTKLAANAQALMSAAIAKLAPDLDLVNPKLQPLNDLAPGLEKSAQAMKQLADQVERLQKFSIELDLGKLGNGVKAPSIVGGKTEGYASGGSVGSQGGFLMDFFSGRFAKGTDIIPAMLSRKEFVVRAPMAERYYSQLVAMNAGTAPIYRAQGGPVTHTSVGDIHITIPGGKGASVKQIAGEIRRGIKQGTLRIN